MNIQLANLLDIAITRRQAGEPIADIVGDYPAHADELRALLETIVSLDALQPVETPSAAELAADRRQFLNTIENSSAPVVSLGPVERLNKWIGQKFPKKPSNSRKRRQPMISSFIVKASLIFTMVFGSAGGTALAAAQSLPDSPLYPIKLAMEETRLQLVNDPAAEAVLHLNLAQERTQEMVQLVEKGETVDDAAVTRLQQHLDKALQLAAQSPETVQQGILTHAQETLQTQQKKLAEIQAQNATQQALQHAQMAIEQAQEQVQTTLQNTEQLREQHQGQHQNIMPISPIATPTEMPTAMPHPTEMPTAMPHPTEMPTAMPHPTEMPHPTAMPTEMPTEIPHPTPMPGMPGGGGGGHN